MGIISEELGQIVVTQIHQHGIVVWYDPERQYESIVDGLKIESCSVVKYVDSFFTIRNITEPLLNYDNAPRLLVYVPMDQAATHRALAELESLGVVLQPGQPQPELNTRLSYVASIILRPILGNETSATLEKQIDQGKLSLQNVDELASKGAGIGKGIISVIFGTANVQEIALMFLTSDRSDQEIIQKQAIAELVLLLSSEYEIQLNADKQPIEIRQSLRRHILAADYLLTCFQVVPPSLRSVTLPTNSLCRTACIDIARKWRMRRDLQSNYLTNAKVIEQQLMVASIEIELDVANNCETFQYVDDQLRILTARSILSNTGSSVTEIILKRQQGFWSAALPEFQSRWSLLASLARLKSEVDRISQEFKNDKLSAATIAQHYIDATTPWCVIDTLHRNVERMYQALDIINNDKELEQLFVAVREQYYRLTSQMSEVFVFGLSEAKYQLPHFIKQREVFNKRVKPVLDEAKIAYIWVDALRYEMGVELAASLRDDFEVTIEAAIASVPTITEIGMSSLLPIIDQRLSVVPIAEGKLALQIGDKVIKDRKARIDFFRAQFPSTFYVSAAKLEELLPKPKKKLREEIAKSRLVLITSQEIDELCEGDNVSLARRAMQDILHELKRAIRVLQELRVTRFIIAADHGHIFGEELSPEMLIDAPGGDTKDLHRRVWLGNGGAVNSAVVRTSLKSFDYESELEMAVPLSLGGFKVAGGARNYFHGGISLQELLIPVIDLKPKKGPQRAASDLTLQLKPGSKKITTRFYSVQITGSASTFMDVQPPVVRVEVMTGSESISTPISASYGFEDATGEVRLRFEQQNPQSIESNTITLQIESVKETRTVSLHLFDSNGVELSRLEDIEFAISI